MADYMEEVWEAVMVVEMIETMVVHLYIMLLVASLDLDNQLLIIRAISRYREYSADRGSAQMTGKPSKLANALVKISGEMSRVPKKDLRQAEGLNAFFIVPAISGSSIINLLSHTSTSKQENRKTTGNGGRDESIKMRYYQAISRLDQSGIMPSPLNRSFAS